MSVINQVLQDLEKRGVPRNPHDGLGGQVRAVSGRPGLRWPLAAAAAAIAAGAAGWILILANRAPSLAQPPASPAAQTTIAVQVPAAPVIQAAKPDESAAAAEPAQPASRLTLELSTPPFPRSLVPQPPAVWTAESQPAAPVIRTAPRSESGKSLMAKAATEAAAPREARTQQPREATASAPAIAKAPAGSGNLSGAEEAAARQFKQVTPRQRADNEFRRAVGLMQQGRVSEALQGYEQALQIDPGHEAARQAMVSLLIENKRVGEAERHLRDGLKADPKQVGFAMTLARIQVERGELAPAVETLEKVQNHGQGQPDYRAFLAALLQRQSRHKEAAEHYQAAVRMAPNAGLWLMGLGISLEAEHRLSEAQEAFRRARGSNSLNPELTAFVDQRLRQIQQQLKP